MAELHVYYFLAEGLWVVGIARRDDRNLGVVVSDPIKEEEEAETVAKEIGFSLELPVSKMEVELAEAPWSRSREQRPN